MVLARDVVIGGVYAVEVNRNVVPVEILETTPKGGWIGKSLKTSKTITIKSADRLRSEMSVPLRTRGGQVTPITAADQKPKRTRAAAQPVIVDPIEPSTVTTKSGKVINLALLPEASRKALLKALS